MGGHVTHMVEMRNAYVYKILAETPQDKGD